MTKHGIIRALLGINGVVLTGIGVMLISDPHAMFALNGVTLSPDPNLLSELRAPGGALDLGGWFYAGGSRVGALDESGERSERASSARLGAGAFGLYPLGRHARCGFAHRFRDRSESRARQFMGGS